MEVLKTRLDPRLRTVFTFPLSLLIYYLNCNQNICHAKMPNLSLKLTLANSNTRRLEVAAARVKIPKFPESVQADFVCIAAISNRQG